MPSNRKNRHKQVTRKKRKKIKNIFIISFVLSITLIIVFFGRIYLITFETLEQAYLEDNRELSPLRRTIVNPRKDPVSILFIGADRGGARGTTSYGLSDSLMLATFNPDTKNINLLSIPRDTYAYLPVKNRYDKINHAHAYGGPLASVDAVESLLNVPVDYFISINFDTLIALVDALDGIYVDVPFEIKEMDSHDKKEAITLTPGYQLLNGEEALAFSRTRKYDNDFERAKRQQIVLKAIVDRLTSVKGILALDDIIESAGQHLTTNLTTSDAIGFSNYIFSDSVTINQLTLQGHDLWTDAYYYELNNESVDEIRAKLNKHLRIDY